MLPEEVPDELVEKAARHRFERHFAKYPEITWENTSESIRTKYLTSAADYLAAVLPDIQADTERRLIKDLEWMADARAEYGDQVKAEAHVLKVAARLLDGGWFEGFLPSWKWNEWRKRLNKKG